jgi:hypothetical protein
MGADEVSAIPTDLDLIVATPPCPLCGLGPIACLIRVERTARAIEVLSRIMDDPKAPSAARVAAARELLDRGHGRAESSVHAKIESADTNADFSVLTPDELDVWHRGSAMLAPLIAKVFHQDSESLSNGQEG